jgi:phosphoribosylaminoimidazolecarboxamide formyltransferase/IMP cyclohydrolase
MTTIRRVLVSVSNKHGLADFIRVLASKGAEILSTGGTAKALREAGIAVTDVSAYTGSPEIMDGRVKTLHPRVHGGILMRERDDDREALASIGGAPIDLVVVNLYPFEETLRRPGASHEDLVEKIDIGGPAMVRAAAKNHARVTVVVDPDGLPPGAGGDRARWATSPTPRGSPSRPRPSRTPRYDGAIAGYLSSLADDGGRERTPARCTSPSSVPTRCGTARTPTSRAAFYRERRGRRGHPRPRRSVGRGARSCRSTTSSTSTRRSRRCASTTCPRRWW